HERLAVPDRAKTVRAVEKADERIRVLGDHMRRAVAAEERRRSRVPRREEMVQETQVSGGATGEARGRAFTKLPAGRREIGPRAPAVSTASTAARGLRLRL